LLTTTTTTNFVVVLLLFCFVSCSITTNNNNNYYYYYYLLVAQWRGNRVGRQQQRGVGLGLKDFLAASGNSEEGNMAVAEISYLLGSKDTVT